MRLLIVSTLLLAVAAESENFFDNAVAQISSLFASYEEAPYNITRRAPGYEEREYSEANWVCTQETNRMREDGGGLFWKLFLYITGANERSQQMDMTVPVTTEFTVRSATDKSYVMCFYVPFRNPPAPNNTQVFIQARPQLKVLTRIVGGYIRTEAQWMKEAGKLAAVIQANGESVSLNHMYWVGYNSPMKFWNRRNEVWFPIDD